MPAKKIAMIAAVLLAIFLLIAAVWAYCKFMTKTEPTSRAEIKIQGGKGQDIIPPPATGNVDDLVASVLKDIDDESKILTQEDSDADLIADDSQEIGDFGQSIDENEIK